MPQATTSAQERFLGLLKRDILKLDLADLDFGIYRILNYRRAQVLDYLDETLPGRITAWTQTLAQASGRELVDTEAANCYYHLHTFFSRYWDDGDFIPRARRGGSPAYSVPYNGQDTHFHSATKGSHYVKSGELFSRYAYRDGNHEVRFVIDRADTEKDNGKGSAKHFFPLAMVPVDGGFEVRWQWRAATDAENKRYKAKNAMRANGDANTDSSDTDQTDAPASEGATLQDRVLSAWLAGADFKSAKPAKALNPVLLASNARRFVRKNTSDFFVHPQLGEFLRGELDVYLKHEFVQVWDAPDAELPRIRAKYKLVRDIALDLIAFLDQIERFQATLFEKRKFVLQADYLLLRNMAGVGVGLFAAEGFFPDFLMWLKRGKHQALAFVEPKGLRHQWPQDKFDLLQAVVPSWQFSVPVRGYVLSANTQDELSKIRPGFTWSSAPPVLIHQDAQGTFVERLLANLLTLLPTRK